jgi:hypothetical protein
MRAGSGFFTVFRFSGGCGYNPRAVGMRVRVYRYFARFFMRRIKRANPRFHAFR